MQIHSMKLFRKNNLSQKTNYMNKQLLMRCVRRLAAMKYDVTTTLQC